jgi:hypothetical protein
MGYIVGVLGYIISICTNKQEWMVYHNSITKTSVWIVGVIMYILFIGIIINNSKWTILSSIRLILLFYIYLL